MLFRSEVTVPRACQASIDSRMRNGLLWLPGMALEASLIWDSQDPQAYQRYRILPSHPSIIPYLAALQPADLQQALRGAGFLVRHCHRPLDPQLGQPSAGVIELELASNGKQVPGILELPGFPRQLFMDRVTHTLPSLAQLRERAQQQQQ
mgnify:CR=1 FL=1